VPTITLDSAPKGENFRIKQFLAQNDEQLRLMELGFQAGALVAVLHRAPLQGLLKVKIKETRFAIRRSDAACIFLEALHGDSLTSMPHSSSSLLRPAMA
jgi:Fe2+ transport system protein FeoA